MQTPRLTDDEARDLFSAYRDRELDPARSEAMRAHLEANPEIAAEYRGFCKMLDSLSAMADEAPAASEGAPKIDVLRGVQRKISVRSKGKFYGDRWSRVVGIVPLEVIAALVLIALVVAYFAMTTISVEPAPTTPTPTRSAPR